MRKNGEASLCYNTPGKELHYVIYKIFFVYSKFELHTFFQNVFICFSFCETYNCCERSPAVILMYTAKTKCRNLKQIFPEKEYRSLSPNFHIHVSVSELYIPTMGLHFLLEEICRPILGIYKSLTDT
jgi:hypothetical protein